LHRQRQESLRIRSSYISVVSRALSLKDLVTASVRGTMLDRRAVGADR
jgi:hypothetical protein